MRIAMVAEGCYPYVVGGVSSWIHSIIRSFPQHEFIVIAIVADRSVRGKFVYELPENIKEVYEVYLSDFDWSGTKTKRKSRPAHKWNAAAKRMVALIGPVANQWVSNCIKNTTACRNKSNDCNNT